jgi:hypothetical protein
VRRYTSPGDWNLGSQWVNVGAPALARGAVRSHTANLVGDGCAISA